MSFAGVDIWAVFIAAIVANVVGAVWYWSLSKPWMAANNLTEDDIKNNNAGLAGLAPYALAFLANLLMAAVLAGVIGHLGKGFVTLRNGLVSGALCWLGFVITSMVVNHTFSKRKPVLLAIDGGYWFAVLVIMGGIIGGMGVTR